MGLHEDFIEQNPEKLMGLFRGLLEERPYVNASPDDDVLTEYPALQTLAAHAERLLLESRHTAPEANAMGFGMLLGIMAIASYAKSEVPGNEDKYPIV